MNFKIIIFFTLLIFTACDNNKTKKEESKVIQYLLNKSEVSGAILIYDSKNNTYYSNNFDKAQESSIPASTYKIPHTIIGLETGLLKNEQTVFKWDGKKRKFKMWEQNLTLKQAFQKSCVPCYKDLAKKIGVKRMRKYLKELSFGRMYVNNETIDNFWLEGKSEINPFEQIDFLRRLYNEELNVSKSTYKTVKNILIIEEKEDYVLSGKTGLANNIGWFVGYLVKDNRIFYFATKITPKKVDMSIRKFAALRKSVTIEALKELSNPRLKPRVIITMS